MVGGLFFVGCLIAAEKEAQKKQLWAQGVREQKNIYLSNRLAAIKSDAEFMDFYRRLVKGHEQVSVLDEKGRYQNQPVMIGDFFAHLCIVQRPEETAKLVKDMHLLKETVQHGGAWILPNEVNEKTAISMFFESVSSLRTRAQDHSDLFLERSVLEDFQPIVNALIQKQRKPVCVLNSCFWFDTTDKKFKDLLTGLDNASTPNLRVAFVQMPEIAATLIAFKEDKKLKFYLNHLRKHHIVDKNEIDDMEKQARNLAQTKAFVDMPIAPCPAIRTKRLLRIFKWSYLDQSRSYECPLMKRVLDNFTSRVKE